MPQLDIGTFSIQSLCVFFSFFLCYRCMVYYIIPEIHSSIFNRDYIRNQTKSKNINIILYNKYIELYYFFYNNLKLKKSQLFNFKLIKNIFDNNNILLLYNLENNFYNKTLIKNFYNKYIILKKFNIRFN